MGKLISAFIVKPASHSVVDQTTESDLKPSTSEVSTFLRIQAPRESKEVEPHFRFTIVEGKSRTPSGDVLGPDSDQTYHNKGAKLKNTKIKGGISLVNMYLRLWGTRFPPSGSTFCER